MLAEASDTPSQLLTAFIRYLRARPTDSEHESAASDEGSPVLEGVTRVFHELGSVPTIMLERLSSRPDRTVVYFHGGGYVSGSPPDRYLAP